jgi:hypothetical protein
MRKKRWYLDTRAEYLATIHLSRRDDLVITKQPSAENYGFDILVSICQNLKPMGRVFGIQLKALKSLKPFYQEQFSVSEIKLNIETSKPKDIPFPIYLFVFTMENDEGYYRKMTSQTSEDNLFKRLNKEAIDKIVEKVNLWYDKQSIAR